MDTDTLMFIGNIQINFDYTKYCPATLDATYNSATERRYDPAQRLS